MLQAILLAAVILVLALYGRVSSNLKTLGLDTIAIVFLPSYVVFCRWTDLHTIAAARTLFDMFDITGWFIVVVVVGSIAAIEKNILAKGLARIALPLIAGSVAAALCGVAVGQLTGVSVHNALFGTIVPVMGGGVTAGALPLSIGYAGRGDQPQGGWLAAILPAVFVGNFMAMLMASILRTTSGQIKQTVSEVPRRGARPDALVNGLFIGTAVGLVVAFYSIGYLCLKAFGMPAPLTVIVIAGVLHCTKIIPARLNDAIRTVYRFCVATFTYPILFAVGLLLTPWESLIRGFQPTNLAIIGATVGTLTITGYVVARLVGLLPADGALITTARAAMGGSGDIAILNVARRMDLMPFAQLATRISGALTVALALAWIGASGAHVL